MIRLARASWWSGFTIPGHRFSCASAAGAAPSSRFSRADRARYPIPLPARVRHARRLRAWGVGSPTSMFSIPRHGFTEIQDDARNGDPGRELCRARLDGTAGVGQRGGGPPVLLEALLFPGEEAPEGVLFG